MNARRNHGRLLWNEPRVIALCALALAVTLCVILLQMDMRRGLLDTDEVPIFYRLFLFRDYGASFLLVIAIVAALVPAVQRLGESFVTWLGERPLSVSVAVTAVLAIGAVTVYFAHPLAMDESTPYMQARIFAHGRLVGQLPPELIDWLVFPPFQNYFIYVSHATGQIASAYWPGFALLLTPFMALGVPWLLNPVLGGTSIWVIHRLTLQLTHSTSAAGAAVLFSLASGAFVINAMSFYSMTAHLLCNAVFALLLLEPTERRTFVAGLVGGLALTLHNPVPHILFAAPWLVWLLTREKRLRLLLVIAAGYLPWVVIVGFGWHELLQNLGEHGAEAANRVQGGAIGTALATLIKVFKAPTAVQLADKVVGLAKVWLWAAPALMIVAGVGFVRHRRNAVFQLLLASALLTLIGYAFVPLSQGHGWGYRYFHSAWFVLPIFAAATLVRARADENMGDRSTTAVARYAGATALGGLLIMLPFFAWNVRDFISAHLRQLPVADSGRPRVVIIDPSIQYYAQDLVQNDPFLRETVVRMVTHGRAQDELMMTSRFPDLARLSSSYRGTVWGHPGTDGTKAGDATDANVLANSRGPGSELVGPVE